MKGGRKEGDEECAPSRSFATTLTPSSSAQSSIPPSIGVSALSPDLLRLETSARDGEEEKVGRRWEGMERIERGFGRWRSMFLSSRRGYEPIKRSEV
jgi:hypothetical protein